MLPIYDIAINNQIMIKHIYIDLSIISLIFELTFECKIFMNVYNITRIIPNHLRYHSAFYFY